MIEVGNNNDPSSSSARVSVWSKSTGSHKRRNQDAVKQCQHERITLAGVESDDEESYKIDNKYVAYNDLGTDDTIYENKDNDETNIIGNTNSDEESEREYNDNGCIFSESDNIEYAQITEYGKGGEGKICV